MMNFFLTVVFLSATALCATDVEPIENAPAVPAREICTYPQAFAPHAPLAVILDLLDKGVDPKDIMIVSDLDGTITNSPYGDHLDVKSRGEMVNIISTLQDLGLNIMISSAWDDFNATRTKICNLNLGGNFLTEASAQEPQASLTSSVLKNAHISYHHDGFCCSVRLKDSDDQRFFPNKAFAPYIVFGEDICDTVSYVFFLDDTLCNTMSFNEDTQKFDLFKKAKKIDIFLLTDPQSSWARRENDLLEILERFKEKLHGQPQEKIKILKKRRHHELFGGDQSERPAKK